jgi:hypothetical protein
MKKPNLTSPLRAIALIVSAYLPIQGIANDDAQLTFSCDGLPGLTVTSHNTDNTGQGRATTQAVQFNVNTAAAPGTAFVNQQNSPTCTVRVNNKFTIVGGTYSLMKGGSWTSGDWSTLYPPPHAIDGSLAISSQIVNNQTINFTMSRKGPAQGNTTVMFNIRYRADKS